MNPRRRKVLTVGGLAMLSLLGGCFDSGGGKYAPVRVTNTDDTIHTIDITIEYTDDTMFTARERLEVEGVRTYEKAIPITSHDPPDILNVFIEVDDDRVKLDEVESGNSNTGREGTLRPFVSAAYTQAGYDIEIVDGNSVLLSEYDANE